MQQVFRLADELVCGRRASTEEAGKGNAVERFEKFTEFRGVGAVVVMVEVEETGESRRAILELVG